MIPLPLMKLLGRREAPKMEFPKAAPPFPRQFVADLMQIEPLVDRFDSMKTFPVPKEIDARVARLGAFGTAVQHDITAAAHRAGELEVGGLAVDPDTDALPHDDRVPDRRPPPTHVFECDGSNRTIGAVEGVIEPIKEQLEAWRRDFEDLCLLVHNRLLDVPFLFDPEREALLIAQQEHSELEYLENRNLMPDHVRKQVLEREEREAHYRVLEARNKGLPPSRFTTGWYVVSLLAVGIMEWILNYFFLEHSFQAPYPAIAFVLLFGLVMATASHFGGRLLKQRSYYAEQPGEKADRRGELWLFYGMFVLMVIGILAVSYARYQYLTEYTGAPGTTGRGTDPTALPTGSGQGGVAAAVGAGAANAALGFAASFIQGLFRSLGSVLATVGFLAAANFFIFGLGVFFSFLHHDRVPGLAAADYLRRKAAAAVRREVRYDGDQVEQIRRRYRQMHEDLQAKTQYVDGALTRLRGMQRELRDFVRRYGIARQADRMAAEAIQRYREQLKAELEFRASTDRSTVIFRIDVADGAEPIALPSPSAPTTVAARPVPKRKIVSPDQYFRLPIRSAQIEFEHILTRPWR